MTAHQIMVELARRELAKRVTLGGVTTRYLAKRRVLRQYPMAWFNKEARTIEGYSEGLILGYGSVIARSIEASAWRDAAAKLRKRKGKL